MLKKIPIIKTSSILLAMSLVSLSSCRNKQAVKYTADKAKKAAGWFGAGAAGKAGSDSYDSATEKSEEKTY